ncbi:uncharacterized protein BJ171DRAFT_158349 [Polychytrium aggregatum]|uniref:uncharacterized protein n=1 Tax=Polychytrium aggregatum TaxID=110093 RepID=UPI0022FEE074|nr:uncharacterized protein BJ171DRAFT_158349 [Polychytrium aggregatum]KAI9203031.1 hypothetical protein BJ171DRAFT_158349 [Polychytrium aggregatum]
MTHHALHIRAPHIRIWHRPNILLPRCRPSNLQRSATTRTRGSRDHSQTDNGGLDPPQTDPRLTASSNSKSNSNSSEKQAKRNNQSSSSSVSHIPGSSALPVLACSFCPFCSGILHASGTSCAMAACCQPSDGGSFAPCASGFACWLVLCLMVAVVQVAQG